MTFDHILDTANLELIYAAEAISKTRLTRVPRQSVRCSFEPACTGALADDPTVAGRTYKMWSGSSRRVYRWCAVPSARE